MPKATISIEPERHELKSAPPDGYVTLRALPYGKILKRRDGASRMVMEQSRRGADNRMIMEMAQEWSRQFDFAQCIVDHNLEDDAGNQLDFTKATTLQVLNPKIGQEIEQLIDELNRDIEEDQAYETFTTSSTGFSPEETVDPKELTTATS